MTSCQDCLYFRYFRFYGREVRTSANCGMHRLWTVHGKIICSYITLTLAISCCSVNSLGDRTSDKLEPLSCSNTSFLFGEWPGLASDKRKFTLDMNRVEYIAISIWQSMSLDSNWLRQTIEAHLEREECEKHCASSIRFHQDKSPTTFTIVMSNEVTGDHLLE